MSNSRDSSADAVRPPLLVVTGEAEFDARPADLFAALTAPDRLAQAMPDLESFTPIDEHAFQAVVRPGFSFLRGVMRLTVEITERSPPIEPDGPCSASMQVAAAGIGSGLTLVSEMRIEPLPDSRSHLSYRTSVFSLTGLVSTISKPLISAAAARLVDQTWASVRRQLDAESK